MFFLWTTKILVDFLFGDFLQKLFLLHNNHTDMSYNKQNLLRSIYMIWPKKWVWWKGLNALLSTCVCVIFFKNPTIVYVLVKATQDIGLVEWLDLVLKVGSVYPTTETTLGCQSPVFQEEKYKRMLLWKPHIMHCFVFFSIAFLFHVT